MLKKKQIVAVAKDVIAQIKLKKFKVKTNRYLLVDLSDEERKLVTDLQKLMTEPALGKKKCQVCARGALILSKANLYNDCPVANDYSSLDYTADSLTNGSYKSEFPENLTARCEVTFEGFKRREDRWENHESVNALTKKEYAACIAFYRRYTKAEDRLLAIMRNIIKNKGVFKPRGV